MYKGKKYYSYSADEIKKKLKKYGVAIYPSILNDEEAKNMISGMWDFYEHITKNTDLEINRNKEDSWKNLYQLYPKHSFLQQHFGVGHSQVVWDLRQNSKIVNLFSDLWNVKKEELLVSFDGFSFGFPHEVTKRGYFRGNTWYHTDQSFTRNNFECIQSWVTGFDVNEGDATLAFYESSHKYHKKFAKKFKITDKSDWYKLNKDEEQFFIDNKCKEIRIKCPKGSIVFWDSRTIHCGTEALKERKKINYRAVIYLCYMPRKLSTNKVLEKKKKAFNELRTTNHWPCKPKLFPKNPRTYGNPIPNVNQIDKPKINDLGLKLAGF